MKKRLRDEVAELIKDDSKVDGDKLDSLEKKLKENGYSCGKQSMTMVVSFLVLFVTWFLLKSSNIDKVNILGLEVNDPKISLSVIPVIVAFVYYRFMLLFTMNQVIDGVLREVYTKQYPHFDVLGVTELLHQPSFLNIENAIHNIETSSMIRSINDVWNFILVGFITLIPPIIIGYMMIDMVNNLNTISIISMIIILLLIFNSWKIIIRGSILGGI